MATLPVLKFNKSPLSIAIDFEVYKKDLNLLREFCFAAIKLGHQIYVYSYQSDLLSNKLSLAGFPDGTILLCLNCPIIKDYFLAHNIHIDIWLTEDLVDL